MQRNEKISTIDILLKEIYPAQINQTVIRASSGISTEVSWKQGLNTCTKYRNIFLASETECLNFCVYTISNVNNRSIVFLQECRLCEFDITNAVKSWLGGSCNQ